MPTNTKQIDFTKPFHFGNTSATYSYEPVSHQFCKIENINTDFVDAEYPCSNLDHWLNTDVYKIILTNENTDNANTQQEDSMTKLEEYIKAINKVVPEFATEQSEGCAWCECPDCKATFSEGNMYDQYGCIEQCTDTQETLLDADADNLLDAIKSFTLSTGSSVFINEGAYEVYWAGFDNPFKADNDHDMINLMESIGMLEGAF